MNLRAFSIILLTAGFSAAPAAFSQEETSREALAARFIELARLDQIIEQFKGGLAAGMQASLQRAIQEGRVDASGGRLQAVTTIVEEELETTLDEMMPEAASVMTSFYAERMTEDELAELVEIYQRPVIDKMYEIAPDLNQQILAVAIAHQKDSEARLRQRLEAIEE